MQQLVGSGYDPRLSHRMADQALSNASARMSPHFSKEEMEFFQIERTISPVEAGIEDGFLSSIFLVHKKDGPIINLKRLNNFIPYVSFQDAHAKRLLEARGLHGQDRPKDAYFVVPISEPDKKYLRFRWKNQMYQFNCLPFGLTCATWIFTKITKAVAAVLRVRLSR